MAKIYGRRETTCWSPNASNQTQKRILPDDQGDGSAPDYQGDGLSRKRFRPSDSLAATKKRIQDAVAETQDSGSGPHDLATAEAFQLPDNRGPLCSKCLGSSSSVVS